MMSNYKFLITDLHRQGMIRLITVSYLNGRMINWGVM